jgi:hypothetical protein
LRKKDRRLQKKVPGDGETVEKSSVNRLIQSMHRVVVGFIGYQLACFSVLPHIELTDAIDQNLFYEPKW